MLTPALAAEGIVVAREQSCVLAGIDLYIMPGEIVSIEGASGAGKTTLLHVLAGLVNAEFGAVSVSGVPLAQLDVRQRARQLAISLQTPALPGELSVLELVRLGRLPHRVQTGLLSRGDFHDALDRQAIERAIAAMGLRGLVMRPLASLSGGEQRRAHLARVLAQDTPVVLLDEPTTHLDELTSRQLLRELRHRAERGTAVVLVTHDTARVHQHCGRSLRLENGHLFAVPLRQNQMSSCARPLMTSRGE